MLFVQHAQQLSASINGIQSKIDELETLLKALRSDKAALEAELQQILTLEGAAESALNQTQSFLSAANSLNRNDLIETFWCAMNGMRNPEMPQLPEAPTETETEAPEPTPPIEPEPAITVEASEAPEPTPPIEPEQPTTDTPLAETNGKTLQSVGSAAFDPKNASFQNLKNWVRSYLDDDDIRKFGKLTLRDTWEQAAKSILNP